MTEARIELPPLPDRMAANLDKHAAQELAEKGRCHEAFVCGYGVEGDLHLWNAAQMREYARAAVLAEMERAARVALDIAKWFVNGDRPDEWKLKEWAESLDRDAIAKAYEDLSPSP
jgi:hypothetical protein